MGQASGLTSVGPNLGDGLALFKNVFSKTTSAVPTYEDSRGQQLSDLGGYKRWTLIGTGLVKWQDEPENLRLRIQELIRENEGKIYKDQNIRATVTSHHCWMLGHDAESARPTVIISHSAALILKRTMRLISRHGVLKPQGFSLKGCPSCDLQLLDGFPEAQVMYPANSRGLPISLSGTEISVGEPVRKATIGGVLILDGVYYGVTVAHAFTEKGLPSDQKALPKDECVLYDLDWAEDDSDDDAVEDDSDDDAMEGDASSSTALTSPPFLPELNDESQSLVRRTDDDTLSIPSSMGKHRVTSISSQHPLRDFERTAFDDFDWALLQISDTKYHGMNGVLLDEINNRWLYFKDFGKSPPQKSIVIATRRGPVEGIGTGSSSSIMVTGSVRLRDVWSVQPMISLMCFQSCYLFLKNEANV